jgi:hypothetical protein
MKLKLLDYSMKSREGGIVEVWNKEVRDSFIKPNIISWSKEVIAKYKVSDVLGSERANVNLALTDYLSQKLSSNNSY